MQVACCQFDVAWEDKPANYRRVAAMVREAELEPGTLLLLPEMFATGFSMNSAAIAEPADGPTAQFLSRLACEHRLHVLGGVVVFDARSPGRARNEAMAFDPSGRHVSQYAKMHLFSFAGEHAHYAAGEAPVSFDWSGCRVAPAVCYDLRFPELFRRSARDGAEVLTVIANWPAARESHWLALLKARAIENQAFVAAVNRVGTDGNGHAYTGRSQVIDAKGEVLADAGGDETVIRASVDLDALRQYRRVFPALDDVKDRWRE
jgi:predicted amidohydrolase